MNRTRFSPAAKDDLSAIWDYTVNHWGVAQAERYILGIREACEALADGRRKGSNALMRMSPDPPAATPLTTVIVLP